MVKDFAEFLDALNKNGASYVVIGGMAVLARPSVPPDEPPKEAAFE